MRLTRQTRRTVWYPFKIDKSSKKSLTPPKVILTKKSIYEPILQNLNGRYFLDDLFKKKLSYRLAEKDAVKQKVLSFQEDGQKRKMVIKSEFTPLLDWKMFYF